MKKRRVYKFIAVKPKTHQLLTEIALNEGRSMDGQLLVIAKFYREWMKKMELVVHD